MDKPIFISGWAGFKELFPELIEDFDFIEPFNPYDYREILDYVYQTQSDIISGWSTGANIILSDIENIARKFKKIFLFAPFLKFTDWTDKRILKIMIKKLKTNPNQVILDFHKNCGIENKIDRKFNTDNLVSGLKYLIDSDVDIFDLKLNVDIYIFHGINDKIVPIKASEEIKENLKKVRFYKLQTNHFIQGNVIRDLINENIG